MQNNLKNQLWSASAFCAAILLTLSACHKSPEEIAALISTTEAAEIVETAVSERTAGSIAPTVEITEIIEAGLYSCGVTSDTTLQKSKNTPAASYNYAFALTWLVNCSQAGIPQNATVNIAGNGSFNTNRWDGSDTTTGQLTLTGLSTQEPAYIVNGSYTLTGDLTGDFRNTDPTFNCVTTLNLTNLSISKSTNIITGGAGTVQVTGTSGNGTTTTLNGALTFNGDGTVTVVINGHTRTF